MSVQGATLVREHDTSLSGEQLKTEILGTASDWAWLNVLAHASESELRTLAQEDYSQEFMSSYDTWRYTEAWTACAVLTASEVSGCSVEETQRRALVPLKSELANVERISPDAFEGMFFDALSGCGAD